MTVITTAAQNSLLSLTSMPRTPPCHNLQMTSQLQCDMSFVFVETQIEPFLLDVWTHHPAWPMSSTLTFLLKMMSVNDIFNTFLTMTILATIQHCTHLVGTKVFIPTTCPPASIWHCNPCCLPSHWTRHWCWRLLNMQTCSTHAAQATASQFSCVPPTQLQWV